MSRDGAFVPSGMRIWVVEETTRLGEGVFFVDGYFDDESLRSYIRNQKNVGGYVGKSLANALEVPSLTAMKISFFDQDSQMRTRVFVDEETDMERRSYLASKYFHDKSHGIGRTISLIDQDSNLGEGWISFVDRNSHMGKSISAERMFFNHEPSGQKKKKRVCADYDHDHDVEKFYDNDDDGDDDNDSLGAPRYQKWRKHTCCLLIQILSYYRSKFSRDGASILSGKRIAFLGEGFNMGLRISFFGEFLRHGIGERNQACDGKILIGSDDGSQARVQSFGSISSFSPEMKSMPVVTRKKTQNMQRVRSFLDEKLPKYEGLRRRACAEEVSGGQGS